MISRTRKILRISLAHVAPGMSLVKWRQILTGHGLNPASADPWAGASDGQVDAVFQEIAGIVKAARAATAEIPQSNKRSAGAD